MNQVSIPNCVILGADDYTFYYPKKGPEGEKLLDAAEKCGERRENEEKREKRSLSFTCALDGGDGFASPPEGTALGRIENARLLAASCFQGEFWSVTVRSKKGDRYDAQEQSKSEFPSVTVMPKKEDRDGAQEQSKGEPIDYSPPEEIDQFLFSVDGICKELEDLLFPKDGDDREPAPHGAIIVTGATASAKSQITMRLIRDHMARCVEKYIPGKTRKPHLLTVEDPIESWFLQETSGKTFSPRSAAGWPFDYTPRQVGVDVETISNALDDALRQTPSAVFISEIREKDGWPILMNFAGTGHLIFTTGHAGSLTESMSKILKALHATTPADRAAVAESIHGLIHVRREFIKFEDRNYTALLPALWRRKGPGKQGLVSDGLSALSPQACDTVLKDKTSSFGRLYFAEELLRADSRPKGLIDKVRRKALELDLEGR